MRRRFITVDQLRQAIGGVTNGTLHAREPSIWGNGTTACASDSKHFGAWDQNLTTQWHLRYGGPGIMIYWHVERQYVDTHGQSEVAFAFCRLLGFQLLPRLKAIHSQRLYRPDGSAKGACPHLEKILSWAINWDLIHQPYDQMVK